MATLLDRLSTYDDGWCVPFLKPIEMAKAGFSYCGIQDQVKCNFCSQVLDSWEQGDDPLAEHMLHSPQCLFVCATKSDDRQVITLEDRLKTFVDKWSLEFLRPIEMAKAGFACLGIQNCVKCLSCWNDFEDWHQGDDPLAIHIFQSPQCPFVLEPTNDLQKIMLKDRLKTFNDSWSVQFLKPVDMAKAGFIYLGIQDHVKCLSCSEDFDDWQQGDDPLVKHLVQSPQCPFLCDPKISYDVCGPYDSEPSRAYIEAKQIQDCLDSVGIIQKLEPLTYPEFAILDTRLKSFDKCLISLIQDINVLCEAGFFYNGNGTDDKMACFCCNLVLYNWDNKDEPWTEHARYSKNCCYLLLKTGKIFVDKVHGVESDITKSNITKLVKLIAEYGDTYIVGTSMKIKSTKKILGLLQNTDLSEINISFNENQHLPRTRNPNTIPDYMLCKICYKEEITVAFVTCGHTMACIQCTLTIVQCAACRHPFNKAMRVYLSTDKDPKLALESSSKCSDNKLDSILCKACNKEDKASVFIPCKHVYACVKCAEEMDECPVCTENICSFIQLHM